MVDMAALAAQYPSVAADLAKAGLTAQQHDAYRVALVTAYVTDAGADSIDPNSVLGKNVAFVDAHEISVARGDDPIAPSTTAIH